MSRCRLRLGLFLLLLVLISAEATRGAGPPGEPAVVCGDYPRAFFFRSSESVAANPRVSFDRWDAAFSRLMGIEGKVLDEEVPGRSKRNIAFFTRFKRLHPGQLVLLHYNGNARDPRYQTEKFFAGHFVYHVGARILSDVPAEPGETEIRVSDPDLFRVEMGRYRSSNDDIGLCALDAAGKPDWHRSEQVQLVSVDRAGKTIRVRRGAYGTRPLAFPAGVSYAAAHATEGPWGRRSHLLWYYNYSTRCPRDTAGRTCGDVHAEEVAARFLPGGELEAFDGLEFDVLQHVCGGGSGGRRRGVDCDADGEADGGFFDGANGYGLGVVEFCRKLRRRLGPDRLILADGMGRNNQRAFEILNGIESEGWPMLNDWEIRDWSGGLNRHGYWARFGAPPVFNYINHKFTTAGATPGSRVRPEVPMKVHRLVFAVATFTDSAVCYSFTPPPEPGEMIGIWDELWKGTEHQLGWLGQPLGPAVRLAETFPDRLQGQAAPIGEDLAKRFSGPGMDLDYHSGVLAIRAAGEATDLRFRLAGVPCDGPDLFVSVAAEADHRAGEPAEIARRMWVGIAPPAGQLIRPELPSVGICLRGVKETPLTPPSKAWFRWAGEVAMGGRQHAAYRVHPPYGDAVGYTYWERELTVPAGGALEFSTGMGEKSPQRSDGVWFRVLVAPADGDDWGPYTQVFEHSQNAHQWVRHRVELADWAGRRVRLKFVADCGPHDNATTDHALWGDAVVVGPEGTAGWTPAVKYMTWLGRREFTSGFYFRDVRGRKIDLEFSVEGPQAVRIKTLRAHAHADAIYRRFEHGLVLANPSPRPYVFDLAGICPGRKFRRLEGSPRQDPVANNGRPVGEAVTLQPLEGLFLVEE